jgi:hypothetical protein
MPSTAHAPLESSGSIAKITPRMIASGIRRIRVSSR